jgi:hypothetical protein
VPDARPPDQETVRLPSLGIPRWVLWLLAAPAILGPLAIFVFILRTEHAHDEKRCPYHPVTARAVATEVSVIEERRSCLPGIEERRFTVQRPDRSRVLGKRRFATEAFDMGYAWQAELGDDDQVRIQVQNPGQEDAMFREGPADGRSYE